jgi:N-dimethylarginine dimethylaminohydrolase
VQDTAVVYGQLAVLARLGAESRRGEEATVRDALTADLSEFAKADGGATCLSLLF